MKRHFHEELKIIREDILKMALLSKEAIEKAIKSLVQKDQNLARIVIEEDLVINELEVHIDTMAHSLLALQQPMAVDMRLLTMTLKINSDLERIGDHAVNIAEKVNHICLDTSNPSNYTIIDLYPVTEMAKLSTKVLIKAIQAFLNSDGETAETLLKKDTEIDQFYRNIYKNLEAKMQNETKNTTFYLALIMIAHNLERIGDLANNIAEDTIYLAEGKEVRHHADNK